MLNFKVHSKNKMAHITLYRLCLTAFQLLTQNSLAQIYVLIKLTYSLFIIDNLCYVQLVLATILSAFSCVSYAANQEKF